MLAARRLSALLLISAAAISCGGYNKNSCSVTAVITPASASADPSAAPPGNQGQFLIQSSVSGNCPLIPATQGTWSTSDPSHTTITQQGLATCTTVLPASLKVTIANSGTVAGHNFTPATLTCQ